MKTLSIKVSALVFGIAFFVSLSPANAQVSNIAKSMINQLESWEAPALNKISGEQAKQWYAKLPENATQRLKLLGITEQNVVQAFEGMSAELQQQIMLTIDPSRQQIVEIARQQSNQLDQKVDQFSKNAGNYLGGLFKN